MDKIKCGDLVRIWIPKVDPNWNGVDIARRSEGWHYGIVKEFMLWDCWAKIHFSDGTEEILIVDNLERMTK